MKYLTLWSASYPACVLYTTIIIHLSSLCGWANIHHYSPPLWWIIVIVTQNLFIFIQEHYSECKKYQVECPRGCGAKMQREKVNWDMSLNGCFYHFALFFKEYVFSLHTVVAFDHVLFFIVIFFFKSSWRMVADL